MLLRTLYRLSLDGQIQQNSWTHSGLIAPIECGLYTDYLPDNLFNVNINVKVCMLHVI